MVVGNFSAMVVIAAVVTGKSVGVVGVVVTSNVIAGVIVESATVAVSVVKGVVVSVVVSATVDDDKESTMANINRSSAVYITKHASD